MDRWECVSLGRLDIQRGGKLGKIFPDVEIGIEDDVLGPTD